MGLTDYPIFDESYRSKLNNKILAHYRFREIGFETAGLFVDRLNTRMNEIMPYYNQLYESELLKFDPLINNKYSENYTKHFNENEDVNENSNRTINKTGNLTGNTNSVGKDVFDQGSNSKETGSFNENQTTDTNSKTVGSDTPQGMLLIGDIESQTWASNAGISQGKESIGKLGSNENSREDSVQSTRDINNTTDSTSNSKENSTDVFSNTIDRDRNNWETLERKIEGMQGVSGSTLLKEFRDTFLNIDMMVIANLNDLFMGVY